MPYIIGTFIDNSIKNKLYIETANYIRTSKWSESHQFICLFLKFYAFIQFYIILYIILWYIYKGLKNTWNGNLLMSSYVCHWHTCGVFSGFQGRLIRWKVCLYRYKKFCTLGRFPLLLWVFSRYATNWGFDGGTNRFRSIWSFVAT